MTGPGTGTPDGGAAPPAPSVLDVFADPAAMADPYPLYRRVLAERPVQDVGAVMLTRHADVAAALRHPRLSVDDRHDRLQQRMVAAGELDRAVVEMAERRSLLHRDPPDHTRLRAVVDGVLARVPLAAVQERVGREVDAAVDAAARHGCIELVSALAFPLPLRIMCWLLGVPPGDHLDVPWTRSQMCADFEGPPVAGGDCADYTRGTQERMTDYFDRVVAQRRRHPGDDLVSALLAAEARGELTGDEVNDTARLLLVAGQETVTDLVANGMLALLRHPDQLRLLADDPSAAAAAVDEVLRFDGPVQFTRRVALDDVDINGTPVARGQMVLLWLGTAGRDPDRFDAPDAFRATRPGGGHLQFGAGVHRCPGEQLARLQGTVALGGLCRRLVGPRLAAGSPRYMPRAIHAIEELTVTFRGIVPAGAPGGSA